MNDVVRELAAISPAPYIHIGGDEVEKLPHAEYIAFIERVQRIVHANGKRMMGWGEVAPFYVDQEAPAAAGGLPAVGPLRVNLPNNHLQYAVTWFGLALALLAVFLIWAFRRLH